MRTTAVARRFAKALFEVGREKGNHEELGRELDDLTKVFEATPELEKVLLNPMYKIEERKGLVDKLSTEAGLSDETARFLNILVDARRVDRLGEIAEAYSLLEDEAAGRVRAEVEAPTELDPALLEEVKGKLESATGKQVVLTHRASPELIGGLVVRIENTILDGSLRTQLEIMKEKLLEGVV